MFGRLARELVSAIEFRSLKDDVLSNFEKFIKLRHDGVVHLPVFLAYVCRDQDIVRFFPQTVEKGTHLTQVVFRGEAGGSPELLKSSLPARPLVGVSEVKRIRRL